MSHRSDAIVVVVVLPVCPERDVDVETPSVLRWLCIDFSTTTVIVMESVSVASGVTVGANCGAATDVAVGGGFAVWEGVAATIVGVFGVGTEPQAANINPVRPMTKATTGVLEIILFLTPRRRAVVERRF